MKRKRRNELFDTALKAFTINGATDTKAINRQHAMDAMDTILSLKEDLINFYPREFTKVLRSKEFYSDTDLVTVLRQLCRYHNRRIVSRKSSAYDDITRKRKRISIYNII